MENSLNNVAKTIQESDKGVFNKSDVLSKINQIKGGRGMKWLFNLDLN